MKKTDRVYIAAIRDIAAGEELTYDYYLYDGDDEAPCYCGSKSCRGSMYSPEELKKKARAAARKKKQAELAAKKNGASRKGKAVTGQSRTRPGLPFRPIPARLISASGS